MLRNGISVALNFILIVLGMLLAFLFEKVSYRLSGRVWQADVPLEGVLWLCGIILLLWAVTLSSGFYIARLDPQQTVGQQVNTSAGWRERVLHDLRWRFGLRLFWQRSLFVTLGIALFIIAVRGLAVKGLVRPEPSQVIFLRPGPPTEQPPILTASLTVFFENGSAELEPFYKGLLKNFAQVDLACNIHELEFTGTASSAPFSTDNEKRNPRLANLRVAAVKREINKYTKDKVRFNDTPWTTETLMAPHRWIRDTEKSTRVLATEPFNRRVDILMHSKGDCELPGNAAK